MDEGIHVKKPAIWNKDKTVTVPISKELWDFAEKNNFDVRWEFGIKKK